MPKILFIFFLLVLNSCQISEPAISRGNVYYTCKAWINSNEQFGFEVLQNLEKKSLIFLKSMNVDGKTRESDFGKQYDFTIFKEDRGGKVYYFRGDWDKYKRIEGKFFINTTLPIVGENFGFSTLNYIYIWTQKEGLFKKPGDTKESLEFNCNQLKIVTK
jgi:hypothetical protein